jgi:hypothetical protein
MTNKKIAWHNVHAASEGFFNTASGVKVDLNHPKPEMFNIEDIAGALSKICRFGGHSSAFYSVAQHSVIMAAMAPKDCKREALLHDAAEAYLGDVIKPLKIVLGKSYSKVEAAFELAIAEKFKLKQDKEGIIKLLDSELLDIEHWAMLRGNPLPWTKLLMKHSLLDLDSHIWSPEVAQQQFMTDYQLYFGKQS